MADTDKKHGPQAAPGYEVRDTNWRLVTKLLLGLALVTVAIVYLLWVLFVGLERSRQGEPSRGLITQSLPLPPEPRLQLSPRQDMEIMRAHENAILSSYGWINREQGIVHIPIEVAMEMVLKEGLPTRQAGAINARDRLTSQAADSASGRFVERSLW